MSAESKESQGPAAPHTQIHHVVRRILEHAQDVVVICLMLVLLGVAMEAQWRLFRAAILGNAEPQVVLSDIVYILILAELYRTLIFYLREHRVSVALILETAIVTSVNHLNLLGPTSSPLMIFAITGLLLVLGILLAMDRWQSRLHNDVSHISAH